MKRNRGRVVWVGLLAVCLLMLAACGGQTAGTNQGSAANPNAAPAPAEQASNYPEKDITIIVGSKPGGGYDIWARGVATYLKKYLPNQVNILVKNEDGAAGKIAARELEKADADGYTLHFFNSALANSQGVLGETSFDVLTWTPIAQITADTQIMAISPRSGYETVQDIINSPKKPVYASQGFTKAAGHAFLITANTMNFEFDFINHPNGNEATMSALRGDTDIVFGSIESSMRFFQDGLIPFVYFGKDRYHLLPDVPTAAEVGFPELTGLGSSRIFVAPPGLPADILEILDEAFGNVAADPEFIAWAETQGLTVDYENSEETGKIIAAYVEQGELNRDVLKDYIE